MDQDKKKNKLKAQANKYFEKDNFKKAIELFQKIYELDPMSEQSMLLRVAVCHEKLGNSQDSIRYFIEAAKLFAESGFFLKAIATLKNVLSLDSNHKETQELIADLYAKNGRLYQTQAKSALIAQDQMESESVTEISDIDILQEPEDHFTETDLFNTQIVEPPPGVIDASHILAPLPEIPLFSQLDREAFIEVMNQLEVKTYLPGKLIIKEDDSADAFYIISEGTVRIKKELEDDTEIELAQLNRGDFFGEMAILGKAKRTASVEAVTNVEVFRISLDCFDRLIQKFSTIRQTLYKFYKTRLLHNLLNTSPLFEQLDKTDRIKLLKQFKSKQLPANYTLLEQDGDPKGLFIVVDGEIKVFRFIESNTRQDITTVGRGAILGEMSLLTGAKPMAHCSTVGDTWVLRLPPKQFTFLSETYPEIVSYLETLQTERIYELDLITKLKLGIY